MHWWVKQILYQHTFARLQTPQGILSVNFVCEFSLHQDPLRSSLVHRYTDSPGLQVHRHLHAEAQWKVCYSITFDTENMSAVSLQYGEILYSM